MSHAPNAASAPIALGLREALRRYEIELIQRALEQAGGNQRFAAQLLDIPRRTLVRKLHELRSSGVHASFAADAEPSLAPRRATNGSAPSHAWRDF